MRNLSRRKIEETFLGKVCGASHPVDVTPLYEFFLYPVRVESDDYELDNSDNIIKEFRLRGKDKTWITTHPISLTLKPNDNILVVDIVRDTRHQLPEWAAIVLIEEKCYLISLQVLVLGNDS